MKSGLRSFVMENLKRAAAVAAVLSVTSCGDDPVGAKYPVVSGEVTGCVQGVVTDSRSGARVNLTNARIYVVYGNQMLDGVQILKDAVAPEKKAEAEGEYRLCGVPFGGFNLPLYVKADGFQQRVQLLTLAERLPNRNDETADAGFWVTPTLVQHVEVFKLADLVQKDVTINVNYRGLPVANATVWLAPNTGIVGAVPVAPLTAKTDASGNAAFPAASVAFGATYNVTVHPDRPVNADDTWAATSTTASIVIGTGPGAVPPASLTASDPFTLHFDIGAAGANTSSEPVLVTRTPSNSFVANGALTLVFDREVKVLTSTLAAGGGGLNVLFAPGVKSDGTACTTAEIGNPVANATTPVTVAISGRIVTITPNFTGGSGAYTPPATCGGASVTYTINTLQFFAVEPNIPSAYTFTDGAVTIETTRRLVN